MDNSQRIICELLSCAIHNRKASPELISSADWNRVFHLAELHSVIPLVYSALDNATANTCVPHEYRDTFFKSSCLQIQALNVMETVIRKLVFRGIPVIAMKGLVLRELYPIPETRTMSDFDLCVKDKDFQSAAELIMEMGFRINGPGVQVHIQLIRENVIIELHRQPFDDERKDIPEAYVDGLWQRAVPVKVCAQPVLTFCENDTILYLLLHMNGHYNEGGFGVRQLCDFVLFAETNNNKIDWDKLYEKVKELHISRFTALVFNSCQRLLGYKLPECLKDKLALEDEAHLELFINDIFSGGTFGASSDVRYASNRISGKLKYKEYKGAGAVIGLISFLFPARERLGEKYMYAKRYPVLLPLAWVHRWFYNIFNRQQRELIGAFLARNKAGNAAKDMEQRQALVRWLISEENESK
jgi:hypothetical protein